MYLFDYLYENEVPNEPVKANLTTESQERGRLLHSRPNQNPTGRVENGFK
jgi:hypothetical protein